jgi:benzoylformate decarboxylase
VELLQIALDPHQLARSTPVRLGLVGHLRSTLEELRKALAEKGDPARARAAAEQLGAVQQQARERAEAEALAAYPHSPTLPVAAVHALLSALPANIPVVDESMTCDDHVRAFHRADSPGRYFAARGGGLGWGMPAALGISLGYGREPVLCMVGDGSAMYSPQALWTAAHENLPVLFAVVNNSQYLMLKYNLRKRYAERADELAFVGMDVDSPAIDFLALARSMGVPSARVERASEIGEVAEEAWRSGGPFLLELPIAAP